ncbi:unnamed protein product [Angiostrongylus costaricensis]|uniref:F-box domain-containing protein n=1 Tax=Angiostrongylus costaricensis TaxID=334426 RepID=A0A0R3PQC4_ANGCS|nr:unnamed protein product [Angiostrongylus costaricensis]
MDHLELQARTSAVWRIVSSQPMVKSVFLPVFKSKFHSDITEEWLLVLDSLRRTSLMSVLVSSTATTVENSRFYCSTLALRTSR